MLLGQARGAKSRRVRGKWHRKHFQEFFADDVGQKCKCADAVIFIVGLRGQGPNQEDKGSDFAVNFRNFDISSLRISH